MTFFMISKKFKIEIFDILPLKTKVINLKYNIMN